MEKAWDWVIENSSVLFSGIGVYAIEVMISIIVVILGCLFFRSKATSSNKVTMSDIRAGGDVVGRDKKGK